MRKFVGVLFAILFLTILPAWANGAPADRGPNGCPPGFSEDWVCLTIVEAAFLDSALAKVDILKKELDNERASRPSRFGWTVGPGIGVAACNGNTNEGFCASVGVYLTYSFRLAK